jgi:CheY-specific phosphatase CheX
MPASQPTHDLRGNQDEDLETLNKVLKERFFPKIVAYAFQFSSKLALLQSFHFEPETIRTFIRADNAALAQINAVIPFSGPGTAGCLSFSGSRETLEKVGQQLLPSTGPAQESRATTVAGDLCNAVMGRFKAFLEQNNLRVKITWPLTTDGFPTSLTYGAGRLTLVEELTRGSDQLFVELCLDSFDRGAIRHKIAPVGKKPGELTFL